MYYFAHEGVIHPGMTDEEHEKILQSGQPMPHSKESGLSVPLVLGSMAVIIIAVTVIVMVIYKNRLAKKSK